MPDRIDSIEALEAIYGAVVPAATLKVLDHVSEDYGRFIEASPFVILSTVGPEGVDCSPRGDPKGFVRIGGDRRTLMIPTGAATTVWIRCATSCATRASRCCS